MLEMFLDIFFLKQCRDALNSLTVSPYTHICFKSVSEMENGMSINRYLQLKRRAPDYRWIRALQDTADV